MGASHVGELVCYQLAIEFRAQCIALTAHEGFKGDRRFCNDLSAAARSVAANIVDGFRRRSHREFARFLEIALSSITEAEVHLKEALIRGYVSTREEAECRQLAKRTTVATSRLRRYLLDS